MSGYYNEADAPQRQRSHRQRPYYEEEEVYHGRGPPPREMTRRHRARDGYESDSTEEITRDYPPDGTYVKHKATRHEKPARRARSVDQDSYYDRRSGRKDRRRYDSYSSSSPSRSPPRKGGRRQSLGEAALAALGIGGATAAASKHSDRRDRDDRYDDRYDDRSRKRGSRRGYSSSRSRSRSADPTKKWQQAIKAAGTAAALEAWKSRNEPGGFSGKGKRVMTAAIGAAGVDKAMGRDPDDHGKRHVLQSAVAGLMSNRLINGSRSKSRSRSRGRGKDDSGPGLGGIASAAGLAGLAAKGISKYRSKSRDAKDDRGRGRRGSYSSYSSASPPPKSRSKSISKYINKAAEMGMAKLGLSEGEGRNVKERRHYSDDDEYYYRRRPRGGGGSFKGGKGKVYHGSSTDSYSSSEEERKQKKMRGKQLLTAGLASVATVHAAHHVYQSMERRKTRHKKVLDGDISPEQAKKQRNRARLGDAASIGIAALGIKGAVEEWKEMKEINHEFHEQKDRYKEKHEHRLAKMQAAQNQLARRSEPDLRMAISNGSTHQSVPPPPMAIRQ